MTPFRKAVSAWLEGRTDAALELLRKAQPISKPQSRIWMRITQTR
jgi:hypothetical protein